MLCEVAFACDLATTDCMMTAEMIHSLAILLESAAERSKHTSSSSEEVLLSATLYLRQMKSFVLDCMLLSRSSEYPDPSI